MVPELCGGAPAGAVDRYGLRALVRQAAGRLAAAGVTSPQVDARILAEHLLGRALLLADGADGDFPAAYDALVLRRECREPLQHIIGRMWLRGAELISRPGVFIVRPETEVVAGAAIEAAREVMDVGTVVILALLVGSCLWLGGLRWGWFAALGAFGALGFTAATMLSINRRGRIRAWLDPDGADPLGIGYQPVHGRYALGTGGLTGVGPGSSRQKWGYLTQADSDYVFAVLGEEFGLVGTMIVIALFLIIGWCCMRIMRRSTDRYVKVVTGGIMTWIVGQALVNMSVVVGLLPVLGVPLPLISAGGSSLVLVLLAVGVLLAFARCEPGAEEAFAARSGAVRRTLAVISPHRRNRAS